jgi:hypothetical protein
VFFSEEKNQKTFAHSGACAAWTARESIKLELVAASASKRHL